MNIKHNNRLYLRESKKSSDKLWAIYECSNKNSVYHKTLLNISKYGAKIANVSSANSMMGGRWHE